MDTEIGTRRLKMITQIIDHARCRSAFGIPRIPMACREVILSESMYNTLVIVRHYLTYTWIAMAIVGRGANFSVHDLIGDKTMPVFPKEAPGYSTMRIS